MKEKVNINKNFILNSNKDCEVVEMYLDKLVEDLKSFEEIMNKYDKAIIKIKAIKIAEDKCLVNIKFKSK
jgi:hypothetical protein